MFWFELGVDLSKRDMPLLGTERPTVPFGSARQDTSGTRLKMATSVTPLEDMRASIYGIDARLFYIRAEKAVLC